MPENLNIYLLQRHHDLSVDETHAAVVVAETPTGARATLVRARAYMDEGQEAWLNAEISTVELVGVYTGVGNYPHVMLKDAPPG